MRVVMNKQAWKEDELSCKPLDTYNEILLFLQDPPPWRSLCKELTPHSEQAIRNIEVNNNTSGVITLETPETFCHFNPDADEVKRHHVKNLPKTLVCHDMANGYHDDRFIDGTSQYDAYTFYNWAGIDIFCYFSHHLITIPPLGWINVGHAHGVKVIGTVITEWAEGVVFWDKILDSEIEYQNFASALVAIAKTLKFDGWLLNIENKIAKPGILLEFVKYLHTMMHQELVDPELIWYDSVTVHGTLNWQNGLNDKNKAFFDACDGLFTNYSWSEQDVRSSALAAADRLTDLYIGIDVWGRNFYGGGQFNTQEAVKVAHDYGCSLAIFAPAWTHEAVQDSDLKSASTSDHMDKFDQWLLRERALWGSFWPFLNTKLPIKLPFQTSFCKGQGKKRRLHGEVLSPGPWYNLRHMHYQPNSAHGAHGFVLSTIDKILHGIYKETEGTVKYQESFQTIRRQLHSVNNRESETNMIDSEATVDNEAEENVETDLQKPKPKKEIKTAFKNFFHPKSQKPQGNNAEEGDENEAGTSRSTLGLVQMSVNVKLGQTVEKTRFELAPVYEEKECLEVYQDDSYTGGSCLKINPSDNLCPEHRTIRLFHTDFLCEDGLIVCVVTKSLFGFEEQFLNIRLSVTDSRDQDLKVVLVGRSLPYSRQSDNPSGILNLYPLNSSHDDGQQFRDLQRYLMLNEPSFYIPVENSYGWKVRYYEMRIPGSRVTSINCRTGLEQGPILLGHLGLCPRNYEQNL